MQVVWDRTQTSGTNQFAEMSPNGRLHGQCPPHYLLKDLGSDTKREQFSGNQGLNMLIGLQVRSPVLEGNKNWNWIS